MLAYVPLRVRETDHQITRTCAQLGHADAPEQAGATDAAHPNQVAAIRCKWSIGHGIAGRLASESFSWARKLGATVDPICPFIKAYIARNPVYQDLLGE